jgi:PAS domain S-box-containing protein
MGATGTGDGGGGAERLRAELALVMRLHDLAQAFLRDGDLPRLLDAALSEALAVAGADRGCLQILHGSGGGLRLGAQRGLVRPFLEYVANLRAPLGGSAVAAGRLLVDDVATSPALAGSADREALAVAQVRALHVTALRTPDGAVVGALSALHRDAPDPPPTALADLDRIAALCSTAIAHATQAAARRPPPASDAELAARLAALEELFRSTVENLPVSLLLCDREGRVLYVDPALGAMVRAQCGLAPETLVGKPGREIWPAFVWDPFDASLRKAVATGQRQTYDLAFTVPSGEVNHRRWSVLPLAGADGQVERVLGINHDVTSERRLVEELRDADRRKGEFIGVLSHELRNPLSAIRSSLYVLAHEDRPDDALDRDRREAARGLIDRQVHQLVHLVDDLLDVTRISQNKLQIQRQTVDLARLVDDAVGDHRARFDELGVSLSVRLPEGPLPASVDPVRVAQVITNLLANAAKFTPAGGAAAVSLDARGAEVVLTVTDTGCGIEPTLMPRLFQAFVQAEGTLERAAGGLGLGLALVRGLVELHGGEVTVQSDGVEQGATFVVRLPLDAGGAADAAGAAEPAPPPRRRRVLVIDDDRDVATGLKLALEIDGHEVQVAFDGARGLEAVRAFAPDFVLCDIGMPGMDGYEVARAIRACPELAGVFLVALTGYAQAVDRDKARRTGFDEHLAKPADMARIHALLSRARAPAAHPVG